MPKSFQLTFLIVTSDEVVTRMLERKKRDCLIDGGCSVSIPLFIITVPCIVCFSLLVLLIRVLERPIGITIFSST